MVMLGVPYYTVHGTKNISPYRKALTRGHTWRHVIDNWHSLRHQHVPSLSRYQQYESFDAFQLSRLESATVGGIMNMP